MVAYHARMAAYVSAVAFYLLYWSQSFWFPISPILLVIVSGVWVVRAPCAHCGRPVCGRKWLRVLVATRFRECEMCGHPVAAPSKREIALFPVAIAREVSASLGTVRHVAAVTMAGLLFIWIDQSAPHELVQGDVFEHGGTQHNVESRTGLQPIWSMWSLIETKYGTLRVGGHVPPGPAEVELVIGRITGHIYVARVESTAIQPTGQ